MQEFKSTFEINQIWLQSFLPMIWAPNWHLLLSINLYAPLVQVAVEVWVRNLALRCLCIFFGGHSARLLLWTCRWATEGCRPLQTFCFWNFFNLLQLFFVILWLSPFRLWSRLRLCRFRFCGFRLSSGRFRLWFHLFLWLSCWRLCCCCLCLPLRCTWFLALVLTSNFLTMTFQTCRQPTSTITWTTRHLARNSHWKGRIVTPFPPNPALTKRQKPPWSRGWLAW